jgi:hypothetical protein
MGLDGGGKIRSEVSLGRPSLHSRTVCSPHIAMRSIFTRAWVSTAPLIVSFLLSNPVAARRGSQNVSAIEPSSGTIVIGFVGGLVRDNDAAHQEVQFATRLRNDYPIGMQVKVFANHQGGAARQAVLRLLDADRNGKLSEEEKRAARIILYGHSWGASEAVALARALNKDRIPVLLTIQVDSVSKLGEDDRLIPANVAQAVNFFQIDGFLHGQQRIMAADTLQTQILGNYRVSYKTKPIDCSGYPWYARLFMKPHIEIESDPQVWNKIESLIRSKLSPAQAIAR